MSKLLKRHSLKWKQLFFSRSCQVNRSQTQSAKLRPLFLKFLRWNRLRTPQTVSPLTPAETSLSQSPTVLPYTPILLLGVMLKWNFSRSMPIINFGKTSVLWSKIFSGYCAPCPSFTCNLKGQNFLTGFARPSISYVQINIIIHV